MGTNHTKIGANDPCPCWTGKKYKRCCKGKIDWSKVLRNREDYIPYMSARGRNIMFFEAIQKALDLDLTRDLPDLATYKAAFTASAVHRIYESINELWPPTTDVESVLARSGDSVAGIYIGDYTPQYLSRAIVRHSLYANKILLVDPFMHPYIISDAYNPIQHPDQHRAQTLRNVNFYRSMLPWIDAGIVEFIRTPSDFDRKLNWRSMKNAQIYRDTTATQSSWVSRSRSI